MRKGTILLAAFFVIISCKKKDPPVPPDAALLIFPDKNSECTVGNDISATSREVDFRWQKANNAETYELRVTNIGTNTTQTVSTQALSARVPIAKGAAFSWLVLTRNSMVTQTVSSDTWRFFNAGSETTRPPFPAEIIAPEMGASVFMDDDNEVTLSWSGLDLDNDIEGFDVYFDTVNPPVTILANLNNGATTQKASVMANTVYYWKVLTRDVTGHTADSGVFEFRVY